MELAIPAELLFTVTASFIGKGASYASSCHKKAIEAKKTDEALQAEMPKLEAKMSHADGILKRLQEVESNLKPPTRTLLLDTHQVLMNCNQLLEGLSKPLKTDIYSKCFKNQKSQRQQMRKKLYNNVKYLNDNIAVLSFALSEIEKEIKPDQPPPEPAPEDDPGSVESQPESPSTVAANQDAKKFWDENIAEEDVYAVTWDEFRAVINAKVHGAAEQDESFWSDLKSGLLGDGGSVVTKHAFIVWVETGTTAKESSERVTDGAVAAAFANFAARVPEPVPEPSPSAPATTALAASSTGPKTLYWVDDNPENNEQIVKRAQDEGITVQVFLTVEELAAQLFNDMMDNEELFKSGPGGFRVITDNHRPESDEGLDPIHGGVRVVDKLKRYRIATKVLVYCNHTLPQAQEMAQQKSSSRMPVVATNSMGEAAKFATFKSE